MDKLTREARISPTLAGQLAEPAGATPAGPARTSRPFWGDLHNHNEIGYGKGSLERSYALARGAMLDVYAFTPHAWWHDLPQDDPKVAQKHVEGFDRVLARWGEVRAAANDADEPGRFTAIVAFEWHSSHYGDYHVLLPGTDGDICRADTLEGLQDYARCTGALLIPHHPAYKQGWRGANWNAWRADVSPVVDGFSEHGNSIEPDTHQGMWGHSMGGAERSQSVIEFWNRGGISGLVGSTDNHWGCPGSYAEGLAAIWAETLTRKGIFDALRARHTYAVSGDRILVRFGAEKGIMGDIFPPDAPRTFHYGVEAGGAVDGVEIFKNGRPHFHTFPDHPAESVSGIWYARVEFGWDALDSPAVTDWTIRIDVSEGELIEVQPSLAGGAGCTERVHGTGDATLSAYTSRRNSRPTSGCVLKIRGSGQTRVTLEVSTSRAGEAGGCGLTGLLDSLAHHTECAAISRIFSAPKITLGAALPAEAGACAGAWTDPSPGRDDFYFLKVRQSNGQCAWTSPIWFTDRTP
ncbi:MAG: DUF3604 domain-containing protein [Verrucomicrobiota bacterium]